MTFVPKKIVAYHVVLKAGIYSEDIKHNNFEANTGGYIGTFLTYEGAEGACLNKLIEIVMNQLYPNIV